MSDFPKALYREGTAFEYEGRSLDMLRVEDADEMKAAQADGWLTLVDLTAKSADSGGMKALREEYSSLVGKRAFPGWDEAELRSRIGKLKDQG